MQLLVQQVNTHAAREVNALPQVLACLVGMAEDLMKLRFAHLHSE